MGWQVLETPGKGKRAAAHSPLPSPFPNSCFHLRAAYFFPLPTLQNTVNLKNKRCRLAGILNSMIKDGGNFSLPGLIEQAADEDGFFSVLPAAAIGACAVTKHRDYSLDLPGCLSGTLAAAAAKPA